MYKITDILSLGTDYTVADKNGKIIKNIQVIPVSEILEVTLGIYDEEEHGTISQYLEKSIAVLSGFENIDMNRVMWYSATDKDVVITTVIEHAIKYGYDKIILEHIESAGEEELE